MAKAIGVIEIDGANYDVASGRTLGKAKRVASQLKRPSVDQVIDGFIKSKASERAPKSAKMADTKPAKPANLVGPFRPPTPFTSDANTPVL